MQLTNRLCQLHAQDILLPGADRRYRITCGEKRLLRHSYGAAIETWTSMRRGCRRRGTTGISRGKAKGLWLAYHKAQEANSQSGAELQTCHVMTSCMPYLAVTPPAPRRPLWMPKWSLRCSPLAWTVRWRKGDVVGRGNLAMP